MGPSTRSTLCTDCPALLTTTNPPTPLSNAHSLLSTITPRLPAASCFSCLLLHPLLLSPP